jgi:hypothetical protein
MNILNSYYLFNQYTTGGVESPLFLCYTALKRKSIMEREKLKLIVRNLELLVDSLKAEVYSDVGAYKISDIKTRELDYDEVFEDSDLND